MNDTRVDRRASWLLGLGALTGVALAAIGILRSGPGRSVPPAEAAPGAGAAARCAARSRSSGGSSRNTSPWRAA